MHSAFRYTKSIQQVYSPETFSTEPPVGACEDISRKVRSTAWKNRNAKNSLYETAVRFSLSLKAKTGEGSS